MLQEEKPAHWPDFELGNEQEQRHLNGQCSREVPPSLNCAVLRKSDPESSIWSVTGALCNVCSVVRRETMAADLIDSVGRRRSLQGTKPHLMQSLHLCSIVM